MLFKEERGQASMEVLLLIGAAVVIAAIAAWYIKNISSHVAPELGVREQEVIHGLS